MAIKQNLKPLQDSLGDAIMGQLRETLGDAAQLLDRDARLIAGRLAVAARRNRQDIVDECKAQLRLLQDEAGLIALEGKESMLDYFLDRGIDVLFSLSRAGLASLLVV